MCDAQNVIKDFIVYLLFVYLILYNDTFYRASV